MGSMIHHAIVVTADTAERGAQAAAAATACGLPGVSAPWVDAINGYATVFVPPDGSNAGWPESDAGDARRQAFVDWLEARRGPDGSSPWSWVEVSYGPDVEKSRVVRADTLGQRGGGR